MNDKPMFPSVVIIEQDPTVAVLLDHIAHMDKVTNEWTKRAARGECDWICSDCCQHFPNGMPDECCYGHKSCTDIILRDKKEAYESQ